MPIRKRLQVIAAKSTSTHFGNEEKVKIEPGDQDLKNHFSTEQLIDPEDDTGGSTHSMTKIKAGTLQQNVGTIDNEENPAEGYLEEGAVDENISTIDNLEDPAEGYLEGTLEDEDEVDDATSGQDQVEAEVEPDDVENNNHATPLSANDFDVEEGDEPPPEPEDPPVEEEDANWDEGEADTESDIEDDVDAEEEEEMPEVEDMTPAVGVESATEELAILDIDETDDADANSVAFASFGNRLLVIRANRIIATMTRKMATASGRDDIYLSDQFQEVTASELVKKGIRNGLKGMGFALAKVNVSKASVVNARVQLAVTKTTAAVRKVVACKEAAFQQSLTIAAVGMNQRYFDQPNELKAHLVEEFQRIGIRGGKRMLDNAFASFGPAYAKSIVELATKISALPEDARAGYVTALDLTSEDIDSPNEDVVPVGFEGTSADNNAQDVGDEFEDDTVSASLAVPGIRHSVQASTAGKYSLQASAVLNGDTPLFS